MSLTTDDMANLVNECKFYYDNIKQASYTDPWTSVPNNVYSSSMSKKCKELYKRRAVSNPVGRHNYSDDTVYNYRNIQPRELSSLPRSGIQRYGFGPNSRIEHFRSKHISRSNNCTVILIIILLFLLLC